MAGKLQIQESFQKIYDLKIFCKNILIEVFGSNRADIFEKDIQKDKTKDLNAGLKKSYT